MNDLGLLSSNSAYSVYSINSVYNQGTLPAKDKQDNSVAQISNDNSAASVINDEAIISDEAKNLIATEKGDNQGQLLDESQTETTGQIAKNNELPVEKPASNDTEQSSEKTEKSSEQAEAELTQAEKQEVSKLKARDAEVVAHEQAHIAAASGINVSAPSYTYQIGPDGNRYAIGGEVSISFSQSTDPEANLKKAQTMKAAALAPADPSSQDRSVARSADQLMAQARQEIAAQRQEMAKETEPETIQTDDTETKISETAQAQSTDSKDDKQSTMLDNKALTEIIYAS